MDRSFCRIKECMVIKYTKKCYPKDSISNVFPQNRTQKSIS